MSGLAWIVFSPVALLMALISTVQSEALYYVQIAVFGTWSICGVVSGIAKMAMATWANRLQAVLTWIAFGYFAVCGIDIALHLIPILFHATVEKRGSLFLDALAVLLTGALFYFLARKRRRNANHK